MDRQIEVKVSGNHLWKDGNLAGVQGEGNITRLRITFDEGWDGFAKSITFFDAKGKNPVKHNLTVDLLEDITASTLVYLCAIPPEPLAIAGRCSFVIEGYIDDVRQRAVETQMEVLPAKDTGDAAVPGAPTPTQAEQLQGEIEKIMQDIQKASTAAGLAEEAKKSAEEAKAAAEQITANVSAAETAKQGAEAARTAAESAKAGAEQAAGNAVAEAQGMLAGYVSEANQAKEDAQAAAQNAAGAVVGALSGYVRQAEQARDDAQGAAQNAAETAAQKAAEETEEQLSEYVSDAEAAKAAAEKARDEAQSAAGGDYLDRPTYDPTGKKTDVFAYVDQKVANIPTPDVSVQIGSHNTDGAAHNDIRGLIAGLTTRLNALADSDDTTLDQMSELVAYIKSNKSLIDAITTAKVNVSDIVNDLVTNNANKPLSAAQGVALKALIEQAAASVGAHNQSAGTITAGTFAGQVVANAAAVADTSVAQVRNIYAGTTDLVDGVSSLAPGDIYVVI